MIDIGLILVLIFAILGGIQFIANFIIEPLMKKKKKIEYHFNYFLAIFSITYTIVMITALILSLSGFFKYYE